MKVLFIAGYGHSGSTLLEQVLAGDDAFVSLGEVKHLWLNGYLLNHLCGCGTPFDQCEFWRRIDDDAFGGLGQERARRIFDARRATFTPSQVPSLVADAWRAQRRSGAEVPPSPIDDYAEHVRAVYEAALAATGATIPIDSSKDPLHVLSMARREDITLHIVHLVRDARGVALSFGRPKRRHEVHWKEQYTKVWSARRSAAVWSYRNLLSSALRPLAESYRLVRYEDFVEDPDAVVSAIRSDVGLPAGGSVFTEGRRISLPSTHQVSGNPNRFEGREVELRLDDRWRSALSPADRVSVSVLAAPLLLRYGYGPKVFRRASVSSASSNSRRSTGD